MLRRFRLGLAWPLFVLATCTAPTPPPAGAPVGVVPAQAPVPARPSDDWRDWPLTGGGWVYRAPGRAAFGRTGNAPDLVLACEGDRLTIARAVAAGAPVATMLVTTSDGTRSLVAAGRLGYAVAALAPRDPLLDALAFSRGRIIVAVAGTPRLVLPAWAEIGRVVEDCRG